MVGKKKSKKDSSSLGRALKNDKFGSKVDITANGKFVALHTTDIDAKAEKAKKMQSITQMTDFQEFYYNAELAEKEFIAERQNAVVITSTSFQTFADEPSEEQLKQEKENWNSLTIPRRPTWDAETSPEELHSKEAAGFLNWRRELVKLEENKHLLLTPFEKNLEVWRQLWRVCERCDVIVQIVDARNPLLFRCPDLEKYVKELNPRKQNLLLLNKADLLTEKQRRAWGQFFKESNLEYIFFSANYEKLKMDEALNNKKAAMEKESLSELEELELHELQLEKKLQQMRKARNAQNEEKTTNDKEEEEEEEDEEEEEEEGEEEEEEEGDEEEGEEEGNESKEIQEKNEEPQDPLTKIFTREELITFIRDHYKSLNVNESRLQVGMVGYPNVGKSSTINVLIGEKKVAVAPTPGKTKHFQTINLDEDICLCDCPGLVFPTFLSTKADMVCNGLLSIHQLQAHTAPIALVCKRIPRKVLERTYGIVLPLPGEYEDPNRPPKPEELLQAHAYNRGWMTVHGVPNESIAARVILKDYMMGKLAFVHSPPNVPLNEWEGLGNSVGSAIEEKFKKAELSASQIIVPVEKGPQERGKSKKQKKKSAKRRTEPTIKPSKVENPYEEVAVNMVAHTKGKFAQSGFTRTAFQHSVVPVKKVGTRPRKIVLQQKK